jgi:hypothetical protein
MKVVSIEDKTSKKRKTELLEILDGIRARVENGEIQEFVAASIDDEGDVQIHACIKDMIGGVGMFEMGKQILINQET